jgi:outer membrane lipoprotein-sorting protein
MASRRAGCHAHQAHDMNKPFRPVLLLLAAIACGCASAAASAQGAGATAAAAVNPRQDLHKAFVHNLALKSYKATMTDLKSNRAVSTVEFQAPDRFRITVPGQAVSVIVGDVMYMSHGGRTMKLPLPKGTIGQYRNEATIAELEKGARVTGIGPGLVSGEPAVKYGFASGTGADQSNSTAWVSARSGHVLMVETTGKHDGRDYAMRVVYSDFDSPSIRIAAPN